MTSSDRCMTSNDMVMTSNDMIGLAIMVSKVIPRERERFDTVYVLYHTIQNYWIEQSRSNYNWYGRFIGNYKTLVNFAFAELAIISFIYSFSSWLQPFLVWNSRKWNECMNEWMYEWMNVWMYECMNEWMYEWMNEWMNEWPSLMTISSSIELILVGTCEVWLHFPQQCCPNGFSGILKQPIVRVLAGLLSNPPPQPRLH